MKTKSLRFGEAVKTLASEAGMTQYKFTKSDKEKDERFDKYKIIKDYSDYFHNQLFENKNDFALKYLKERKLSENIIKKFNLGFVPQNNNFLNILLKKYSIDDIKLTGLYYFIEKSQKYVDRFNSRILFPIRNLSDDIIAFGGRIINKTNLAKYINSPETVFFKKGRLLFNLNNAKDERSSTKEVIIVEGYMDVISLYNKGIKNVISNSGTAITENQIYLIWKFFSDPIICMDGDKSGQQAAVRISERLFPYLNDNNKIFISVLKQGEDPDDIVNKKGKKGFEDILKEKRIIQKFLWDTHIDLIDKNNPYEIAKFEKDMRKLTMLIKDETLKKYILEDFLNKINELTPNLQSKRRFKDIRKPIFKMLSETKKIHLQKKNFTRQDLIEFSILYIMIFYSPVTKRKFDKISNLKFLNQENDNLKDKIINLYNEGVDEKEFENIISKENNDLIKKVIENSDLKIILNKKNYDQIEEVLNDLIFDYESFENDKKIESLEKKIINNMDENAYSELIKLKSQINRE